MNDTRRLNNLFGKYELEAKIGSGGMAVVYRAFDPARKRRVALKILHSFLAAKNDDELKQRFHREADIIAQLDHPNIVRIFDHGEVDGTPYLTMEYMSRGNLAQRFEEPTPISLQTSAFLLAQIADGLDYAHGQGIIHRDIKLENVLLDDYNRPALTDFGIARVRDATRLTGTSVIVGTPLTMSPEQSLGNYPNLDYRSDLYSLAVMAYLMTTGFFPFTGDEPLAILHKHLSALPPVPSRVNIALPPELDVVLLKGLAKDPGERYQSAGEFAAAFKDVVSQVETQTGSIVQITAQNPVTPSMTKLLSDKTTENILSPPVTEQMPPLPARRRNRTSELGIGLLMALALLVIGFFVGRLQSQSVAAVPTEIPTLFDPNGTVSFLILQTIESYTDTPTLTPTDGPTETATNTLDPSITPTVTSTATDTQTPSSTPTPSSTATFIPNANGEVIGSVPINAREGPSVREDIVFSIPPGTAVQLVGRSKDSTWLQVSNERGEKGWVAARLLDTTIPVARLPITEEPTPKPTPTSTATLSPGQTQNIEPTESFIGSSSGGGSSGAKSKTPTPTPTDTPSSTPTAVPPTATPSRTPSRTPTDVPPTATDVPPPTPIPAIQLSFSANPSQIDLGDCSTLTWSVSNADEVYLSGNLTSFSGSTSVCPGSSTTYTLSAYRDIDGAYTAANATVSVIIPPPPPTDVPPPPTDVPSPTPEETQVP